MRHWGRCSHWPVWPMILVTVQILTHLYTNHVFFKFYTSFPVCTISCDASPARRNTLLTVMLWIALCWKVVCNLFKCQQLRVWNWAALAEWFPGETWISLHRWVLFEFMLLKWKPARQEIVMKPCKWLFKVYLLICISVMHTHIRTSSYCTVIDYVPWIQFCFLGGVFSPLMCRSLLFLSTRGRKLKGCKIASWCSFSVFL